MFDKRESPFVHWVGRGGFDDQRIDAVRRFSLASWVTHRAEWVRYDNDCERKKWTCNDPGVVPHAARMLETLLGPRWTTALTELTGIAELEPDLTLHGAGVHIVEPGGHLSAHLDYGLHPRRPGLERRVNLILFLNGSGEVQSGGAFALYHDDGATVGARVYPQAGKCVVWCPGDVEYHGTEPVADHGEPRVSLAAYYLAPARPTAVRKRALFVPFREAR